jgi:hypothetical protein
MPMDLIHSSNSISVIDPLPSAIRGVPSKKNEHRFQRSGTSCVEHSLFNV